MKNLWSEILVPAVIAGLTVIGTVGVESARTVRPDTRVRLLREVRLDTLRRDTVPQDTGKKAAVKPDTVKTASVKKDTVLKDLSDDNFDFFGVTVQDADTTPKVFARDTMKVPDSLRITDPFLYRWYVATKDSLTHRIVVDSLMAAGDTLDWPRIDSLYLADSTQAAIERFERWYAGLSKAERKRYENEKKIARTIRRQDSIQHIKDSIKLVRDSIIENTPRILETAWMPDSLYYKRLITWKKFNVLSWLGIGTAAAASKGKSKKSKKDTAELSLDDALNETTAPTKNPDSTAPQEQAGCSWGCAAAGCLVTLIILALIAVILYLLFRDGHIQLGAA